MDDYQLYYESGYDYTNPWEEQSTILIKRIFVLLLFVGITLTFTYGSRQFLSLAILLVLVIIHQISGFRIIQSKSTIYILILILFLSGAEQYFAGKLIDLSGSIISTLNFYFSALLLIWVFLIFFQIGLVYNNQPFKFEKNTVFPKTVEKQEALLNFLERMKATGYSVDFTSLESNVNNYRNFFLKLIGAIVIVILILLGLNELTWFFYNFQRSPVSLREQYDIPLLTFFGTIMIVLVIIVVSWSTEDKSKLKENNQ